MDCSNGACMIDKKGTQERKFVLIEEGAKKPVRSTKNSAGYDFYSCEDVVIHPRDTFLVSTGVAAIMHEDEYLDLRIRSSTSLKGIIFLNSCGVIDSDYFPNVIKCIMHNISDTDFVIHKGDKIAQGIFTKYYLTDDDYVSEKSDRVGGFGSTGGI